MADIEQFNWRAHYEKRIAAVDAFVVLWATAGALIVRFGTVQSESVISKAGVPDLFVAVILAASWWLMLSVWGSRDSRILGYGHEEYKRVVGASVWFFGLIAIVSYTFQFETARGYVGIALPAGLLSLILARFLVRQLLQVERRLGRSSARVLIIGGASSAEHLARSLTLHPMAGYLPVATYLPGTAAGTTVSSDLGLTNLGRSTDAESIARTIEAFRPDAVALSGGVQLPPQTIRALGWALADLDVRMIMAPALTDVAGPRIHTQPVAGLPLIHVSTPNLAPRQRFVKRVFDLAGAAALLIMLAPVLLVLALVVRTDSPGPALFKQDRVGAHGAKFKMLKFRSMVVDAESRLGDLRARNQGNGILFKMQNDPRVTRVGRFIRRYSLDELPQLLNVLNGSMSLVGPRPPLPSEVEKYEAHVHRRLLVRPGLTGLWQVSGRSLLSWEDSVRLDLYYVENWSLAGDFLVLLRTIRAVFRRTGAY
ncbi:exopolysaccharide biosynthesis polyprenyl glycosylphosphotransferase [Arthrobacter ginsengisoli]|uniref:Exopolysaccharide biosynthesis polyprenyl glycosylphosphotransferase n=1 Tax=Arthrobacter ginsengisoli TaxID=1356565 RepID=A0ABU1UDI6_9MICC|nr:sugar transferase [Arthrobacter ginsengisoli]MDR7083185.1 exopolysaccharide biosynthesis polyprenyl glycosylphosphotransferase [Arthrobacter ginsengisoli]